MKTSRPRRGNSIETGARLRYTDEFAQAAAILEQELSVRTKHWPDHASRDTPVKSNLAHCYQQLGRSDDALRLRREIFDGAKESLGAGNGHTLSLGCNLCTSLAQSGRAAEARTLHYECLPLARKHLGPDHDVSLSHAEYLAATIRACDPREKDALEAEALLKDTLERRRRVFGAAHPSTRAVADDLESLQQATNAPCFMRFTAGS